MQKLLESHIVALGQRVILIRNENGFLLIKRLKIKGSWIRRFATDGKIQFFTKHKLCELLGISHDDMASHTRLLLLESAQRIGKYGSGQGFDSTNTQITDLIVLQRFSKLGNSIPMLNEI
ncbi:hypothetical protein D3C76_1525160 [compost metagenome]